MRYFLLVLISVLVFGCEGDDSGIYYNSDVNEKPYAAFTYVVDNDNLTVKFKNYSRDFDGTITSYVWNFGDTQTSLEKEPIVVYGRSGVYDVTLYVYDNKGDYGDTTSKIAVNNANSSLPLDIKILSSGINDISASDAKIGYSLLANIPADKSGGNKSYNISSVASVNSKELVSRKKVKDNSSFIDPYKRLRDREHELLKNSDNVSAVDGKSSARTVPSNITLGTVWNGINAAKDLSVEIYDVYSATCVAISDKAYIFVDSDITLTDEIKGTLQEYADKFDNTYTTLSDKFAPPDDIDNNGKVIIFFYNMADLYLGYFDSIDKFPISVVPASNVADIFYVNYLYMDQTSDINATLAHELQHMLYFDARRAAGKSAPDVWLNESLSMLSEYYAGFYDTSDAWMQNLFTEEDASLLLIGDGFHYGYVSAYSRYIMEQFGDVAIKNIYSAPDDSGIKSVEFATGADFNVIFKNFLMALYFSGSGFTDDTKYNFKSINVPSFHIDASRRAGLAEQASLTAGGVLSEEIAPYSFYLAKWAGKVEKFNITGADFFGFYHK